MKQFDPAPIKQAFRTQTSSKANFIDKGKGKFWDKGQGQGRGRGRGLIGNFGHDDHGEGTSRGRGRGRPLSQVQCYHCRSYGHTSKYCRKKQIEESRETTLLHERKLSRMTPCL